MYYDQTFLLAAVIPPNWSDVDQKYIDLLGLQRPGRLVECVHLAWHRICGLEFCYTESRKWLWLRKSQKRTIEYTEKISSWNLVREYRWSQVGIPTNQITRVHVPVKDESTNVFCTTSWRVHRRRRKLFRESHQGHWRPPTPLSRTPGVRQWPLSAAGRRLPGR